jgi:murein DD-endopeptidase MepM/ murein hydrolase activator NlpD
VTVAHIASVLSLILSPVVAALLAIAAPPVIPVRGTVVDGFRAPACQRCAGHRGVTIATTAGSPVRAVTAGVIVFVGQVANVLYVVEDIGSGARVTYGQLRRSSVVLGSVVASGETLGESGEELYLGVRLRGKYVNPLQYLGFGTARLVGRGSVIVAR